MLIVASSRHSHGFACVRCTDIREIQCKPRADTLAGRVENYVNIYKLQQGMASFTGEK